MEAEGVVAGLVLGMVVGGGVDRGIEADVEAERACDGDTRGDREGPAVIWRENLLSPPVLFRVELRRDSGDEVEERAREDRERAEEDARRERAGEGGAGRVDVSGELVLELWCVVGVDGTVPDMTASEVSRVGMTTDLAGGDEGTGAGGSGSVTEGVVGVVADDGGRETSPLGVTGRGVRGDLGVVPLAVGLRELRPAGGGLMANSCAPGIGGGRKEEDGEGKGDEEGGASMDNDNRGLRAGGRVREGAGGARHRGLTVGIRSNYRGHGHS